jgi:lysozyme
MNDELIKMIKRHEGFRSKPYRCTAKKLTIGYGRNLDDVGISEQEAEFLLSKDIKHSIDILIRIFPDFYAYTENRQNALIDMMFNLGANRFLLFRKMIIAIKKDDWEGAANEAKDSEWHKQVGYRALEIEHLLKEG